MEGVKFKEKLIGQRITLTRSSLSFGMDIPRKHAWTGEQAVLSLSTLFWLD